VKNVLAPGVMKSISFACVIVSARVGVVFVSVPATAGCAFETVSARVGVGFSNALAEKDSSHLSSHHLRVLIFLLAVFQSLFARAIVRSWTVF